MGKLKFLFIFLIFSLFSLFISSQKIIRELKAQGNSYYVATNGNDSNSGILNQPWRTIQKAANTLVAGDTVYVRGGTYSRDVNLTRSGTQGNYITFAAYPGETPVLEPSDWVGFTDYNANQVSWFIIDGFEIRGFQFGIYLAHSSNFILRNNNVHHNSAAAINIGGSNNGVIAYNTTHDSGQYNGMWVDQSANLDIHHNVSYSNFQNGIAISHGSNDNLIHHNVVYNNSCGSDRRYAGIAIEVNSQNNTVYNNIMYANCHAGFLTNSPNNEIYHNVMYGNDDAQVSMGPWEGSKPEGNIFKNNIFFVTRSADKAVQFWSHETPYNPLTNTFDYNLYYCLNGPDKSDLCYDLQRNYSFAQWQSIAGKEQHGFLGNPQFVDPGDNNFHLQSKSPAIDAGIDVGITNDFDDNLRPQGAGYDIGAYEYGGTQPRPTSTPTPKPSFSLSSGWNQVSWGSGLPSYTAKSSLEDINQDCGSGTGLVLARKNKDFWEEYIQNHGGLNFNLQNGGNYFLKLSKNCTWTP